MSQLTNFLAVACLLQTALGFSPQASLFSIPGIIKISRGALPRRIFCSCRRPVTAPVMAAPVVKRVAIVGAGVGGLTLANALCKGGMAVQEVKVFEKFESVKPGIGGGVQINSGAVVLARLGLGDAIKVRTSCRYYIPVGLGTLGYYCFRQCRDE